MIAEVLPLMHKDEANNWPVYQNGQVIGKISYQELIAFLDHTDKTGNIYAHKLHFDLGTALHAIREMRTATYKKPAQTSSKRLIASLSTAAVITMAMLGLTWLFFKPAVAPPVENGASVLSNKLALTLTNGKQILLDNTKSGLIVNSAHVTYDDGTPILSSKAGMTINTPETGQYQVTLPDGTKVWLNTTSQLQFPSTFTGLSERRVRLNGEAYFEVARITSKTNGAIHKVPFIVESKGQEIEVLGTHFDVRAYHHETAIKTTLLEGSVRVTPIFQNDVALNSADPSLIDPMGSINTKSGGKFLKHSQAVLLRPNQQAILAGSAITVRKVNAIEAIAWKNGEFIFRNMPLENVMHMVACWYDIDVVYQTKPSNTALLGGTIAKTANITEVLHMLEMIANVHFKVEGRKVTVIQ